MPTRCCESGVVPMRGMTRIFQLLLVGCVLAACGPNEKQLAEQAEKKRIECLDKICAGDALPETESGETVLKLNGNWYIGPREYFSAGINGASFGWWSHGPISLFEKLLPELQLLANKGKSDEFTVIIFLRSQNIPPEPRGYQAMLQWESEGRIADRRTIRKGLEAMKIQNPDGTWPRSTTYLATELKGFDGLPPMVNCDHTDPRNGCSASFLWRNGVFAGIRMDQRHGTDWPEVFQEITRVLQLLRRA